MRYKFIAATMLMSAIALSPASSVFAQKAVQAEPSETNPFDVLANALASEESMMQSFRMLIDTTMPKMFMADENVAALELVCPGTVDVMMGVIEPLLLPVQQRGYAQYRTDLTGLFAEKMTADEAGQAAKFYSSDLGRKFVSSVVGSSTLERSLTAAMANEDSSVDADSLKKDTAQAALRGAMKLEPGERLELIKILGSAGWVKTYRTLSPQIQEMQLKLANTDLGPGEEEQFERDLGPVLDAHLDACPIGE